MLYILKRCYNIFFFNICSLFRQHFGTNIFLDQHFLERFLPLLRHRQQWRRAGRPQWAAEEARGRPCWGTLTICSGERQGRSGSGGGAGSQREEEGERGCFVVGSKDCGWLY
jgi:hypothetical protein